MHIVPFQRILFDLQEPQPDPSMERSGEEILKSVIAYLNWRAGEPWRNLSKSTHRYAAERWNYVTAVRLVESVRYCEELPAKKAPKPEPQIAKVDPQRVELESQSRLALANRLIAIDPNLTSVKLLSRLPKHKLASMVLSRIAEGGEDKCA